MRAIRIRRETAASPQALFDLLSDPATYMRFPDVKRAELVRPGVSSRFGVGAVRRIWIGLFRFEEQILISEPGRRLVYRVIRSSPPLEHERGTILFSPTSRGCMVEWTSTYRVPIPIIGPLLQVIGGWRMRKAFDDAIRIAAELACADLADVPSGK